MAEKMLVSASTGVINSLLGKLATLMGAEYTKLKDVRKQMEFLHEELSSFSALLKDLADMEGLDNQTKQWRNKVKEMSYDIKDYIDDFTRRVEGPHGSKGFLRRIKTLRVRHQLANEIQELKARVEEASKRRMRYKLDDGISRSSKFIVGPQMTRSGNAIVDPRMTALYVDVSRLVGIGGPKEEVIDLLTKQVDDMSIKELRVVSIVGFGGLGKTSLANAVYNKFGESFGCKAFVSVSQRPDIKVLLMSLATQISVDWIDTDELPININRLRKYLQNKSYLVVVDDLWDASAWESIKCAFPPEGHNGSRILTTTRIERVAVTCCNYQWEFIYRMKPLDDHNSRQLFYNRVFGLGNTCPEPFEGPSDKILQKCGGMPLAIISIASLLASQSDKSICQWTYVLDSIRSDLRSNPTLEGMMQILNLSYTHLPHHLKTCLLYIGMYPEDHDIEKDNLIMQWVAEGFAGGFDGRDALEVAGSYFNELVNRNMIIQHEPYWDWCNERIYCKVHDMVLDLVVSKSKEECFLGAVTNLQIIPRKEQARRLSLQNVAIYDQYKLHVSLPHVRSLFAFEGYLGINIQQLELRFLQVLFIYNTGVSDLTQIRKLFHLRYLYIELNNCSIEDRRRHAQTYPKPAIQLKLPGQIGGLKHLETLMIDANLYFLPNDIVHLPALSYLWVPMNIVYPDGISNMKSLHTLGNFDPSIQSVENLRALGELPNLRELYMHVRGTDAILSTNTTHKDALLSSIVKLINCNLRRLTLSSPGRIGSSGWNSLCFSSRYIEQLHLRFRFPRLPVWVGQLSTLNSLEIHIGKLCEDDIAVLAGLPALARLVLSASRVPDEGIIFGSSTAFRTLRYFEIARVLIGDLTFRAGAMPKVETLGFPLHMDEVKECGVRVSGIEYLADLKNVDIRLEHYKSEESDVPTTVAAIKSFFDAHPGSPATNVKTFWLVGMLQI